MFTVGQTGHKILELARKRCFKVKSENLTQSRNYRN